MTQPQALACIPCSFQIGSRQAGQAAGTCLVYSLYQRMAGCTGMGTSGHPSLACHLAWCRSSIRPSSKQPECHATPSPLGRVGKIMIGPLVAPCSLLRHSITSSMGGHGACASVLVWRLDSQDVAWGPVSSPEQAMAAFAPRKSCLIKISHAQAGWRAEVTYMPERGISFDTAISPCGSTLVLLGKASLAGPYIRLYHHVLATQLRHINASVPQWQSCIDMGWAPFARAWPQVYAYIGCQLARRNLPNDVGSTAAASVDLVDAASHKTSVSWQAQAQAGQWDEAPFQDVPRAIKWASHGRHLAVLCSNSVLVVTFRSTAA